MLKEKEFDHDKAKEISIAVDPHRNFFYPVVRKIHYAPGRYTLKGLMESLGWKLVYYDPKECIAALESIYDALCQEQQFIQDNKLDDNDTDTLFNEAFNALYFAAQGSHKKELIAALNDCCPEK